MGKTGSFRKLLIAVLSAVLVIPTSLGSIVSEPVAATASDVINEYVALTPARLLDTRPGQTTIDNLFAQTGLIRSGQLFDLRVLGRGGVPLTGVAAVALNVTVTDPTNSSFLSVFPKGEAIPNASNLNFVPGQTIPNMVIAKVGADGSISIRNGSGAVHVIVDIAGWYAQGGTYSALTPARLLDTRPGQTTIDNQFAQTGVIRSGQLFDLRVLGRGGVPLTGVAAVAINVTVTDPTNPSFLSVFPKGEAIPNASNLNFVPGQTIPNMVIAKVGADGSISIRNGSGAAHVIVDVAGWFAQDGAYSALSPSRLMDSRSGEATIDNRFARQGLINSGQIYHLQVLGRGGVPATGVSAVAVNVTVTGPTNPSFLSVFPKGEAIPNASNLNFVPGQTIPNMVIAKVGADGSISIRNGSGAVHVIVDIAGWYASPTETVTEALPQNTVRPTLSGNLAPGFVITANPGTWTGSPTPTYTYNWLRCTSQVNTSSVSTPANCLTILGQTGPTYTLTFDDANRFVVAEVSGTNSAGSTSFWTSSTALVAQQSNLNLVLAPVRSGNGSQGSVLSVTSGQWFGEPSITYSWMRCDSRVGSLSVTEPTGCVTIADQTSSAYTISQADAGRFVLAKVTATNLTGSLSVWTSSTQTSNPANTVDPTISGSATNLSTLTANVGTWQGFPIPTYTYQWFRCDSEVASASDSVSADCLAISGATASTLVLSALDVGKHLMLRVAAANSLGSVIRFSASTDNVTTPPLVSTTPTVSGARDTGQVLTVSNGTWIASPVEMETSHHWFRCTSSVSATTSTLPSQCSEISGATSATYTQTPDDVGRFITVRTSRTNIIGTTNLWSVVSEATVVSVQNVSDPTVSGVAALGASISVDPGTWVGSPSFAYLWFSCANAVDSPSDSLADHCIQVPEITSVTSGKSHACARALSGHLQCWGTTGYGKLGRGGNSGSGEIPALVLGPSSYRSVSAGNDHTCAVLASGVVQCWGSNEFGQLGSNGTMSNQVQIQSPMNVLGLTNATAVSAGGGHTCALLSGGSLACWGKNSSGQLGNGGSLNRATPLQVGGVSSAVSLSSGSSHTCAVLANGTVQCWGNNGSGRLGDGTGTNRLVPTSVSGITTAISVSAGAEHTCAVLANGTVQCWGNNGSGRLGDGTGTNRLVPTSVSGITTAISVSAGGTGTCYVSQNGSVECWGSLDGREFILKGQSVLLPRTYMSVIPIRTSRQITLESSQDEETGRYLVARVTATNSSGSIVRFTKSTQAVQN